MEDRVGWSDYKQQKPNLTEVALGKKRSPGFPNWIKLEKQVKTYPKLRSVVVGLDIKISYHNDFAGAQVLDIFHGRGQVGEN